MFLFVAFLIFFGALMAAAWYTYSVPRQAAADAVSSRLRELRAKAGTRGRGPGDLVRSERRGSFAFVGDFFAWLGILRRLQEYIAQANLKYRPADVFALSIVLLVVTWFAVGVFGAPWMIRLILAAVVGGLPLFVIMRVRARRLRKFEDSFPDTIDLFNRSMKAGHTIHSGLETIAQESFDPIRMEFKKTVEELALGSTLEDALHNLGKRIPLLDLKFFITGLVLQRQTGANLVEVLDNLSTLVRERLNMAARMKAHTAQQRMSAGLLCAMPVVMGIGFWIVKPEYMELLFTDETGSKFLTYAIVSEIIGILVLRKIANPRF